jgi:hypothetical protein
MTATATGLATPDTNNATEIDYDGKWSSDSGHEHWPADFRYSDKVSYYEHLNDLNCGRKNGGTWWNQKYFTSLSNVRLIETLSSQFELLPRQAIRAKSFFLSQNLQYWGIKKTLVAWATCAYVIHSDEADVRRCHPLAVIEDNEEDRFWELTYDLDFSKRNRIKTYHKVQSKMD